MRAICRDRELLLTLGGNLEAVDPEELAREVGAAEATTTTQEQQQQQHRDNVFLMSSKTTFNHVLGM